MERDPREHGPCASWDLLGQTMRTLTLGSERPPGAVFRLISPGQRPMEALQEAGAACPEGKPSISPSHHAPLPRLSPPAG